MREEKRGREREGEGYLDGIRIILDNENLLKHLVHHFAPEQGSLQERWHLKGNFNKKHKRLSLMVVAR